MTRKLKKIEDRELREIVDMYISHVPLEQIAVEFNRSTTAINHLIFDKVAGNYNEGGKRLSAVDRLASQASLLGSDRELSDRDIYFFAICRKRGRTLEECGVILYLNTNRLEELQNRGSYTNLTRESLDLEE